MVNFTHFEYKSSLLLFEYVVQGYTNFFTKVFTQKGYSMMLTRESFKSKVLAQDKDLFKVTCDKDFWQVATAKN